MAGVEDLIDKTMGFITKNDKFHRKVSRVTIYVNKSLFYWLLFDDYIPIIKVYRNQKVIEDTIYPFKFSGSFLKCIKTSNDGQKKSSNGIRNVKGLIVDMKM